MTHPFLKPVRALVLGLAVAAMAGTSGAGAQERDGDPGAYLAARISMSSHDYSDAAYWFARALLEDPENTFLLEGLVLAQIGLGDFDLAIAAAEGLEEVGGRSIASNIAFLVRDVQAEDFAGLSALPEERSIGGLFDRLVGAWADFGAGKMSDAVKRFDEIAATDGLKIFGLYHKALALAAVGDFGAADQILSGAVAGPLIVNRRGVIAHAQILSQLERPKEALDLLDRSFGTDPEPQLDAMRRDLKAGKPIPFDGVTDARDGMAEVFFTVATALNGETEPSYTLLYARAAMALNPDNIEATLLTANLLEQLGQTELASQVYASVQAESPAFYTAELGRISTLFALEEKDAAFAALDALAQRFPDLSIVQMSLGDALRRNDRFAEAAEAYGRAIALVPKPEERHWGLFYARGVAFERSGQWDKAEPDFRMAMKLNPEQPQVLNYLGYSFVDKGQNLDEGLALIEKAVALEPEAGYIIDSLAWAFFRLGRYDEALEPMERASLLEPVDPVVTDHLGDVYWAVGRRLEARFQWRRALSFDPEEKEATRIRKKLEIGLDAVLAEEGAPALTTLPNGN